MLCFRIKHIKALLLFTTVAVLLSMITSCHRKKYVDIYESQKEAESLDVIPETNNNITGENSPDYQTPVILTTGNTPFYEGKTLEDLQVISRGCGNIRISLIPTGRLYDNADGTKQLFYNKLTGNFSNWCSDPLCDGKDCIWLRSGLYFQYISDDYIYFLASMDEMGSTYGVFRCDFQRNNIEKVLDVAYYQVPQDNDGDGRVDGYYGYMDDIEVLYEKDNVLYYLQVAYNADDADAIGSLYAMDVHNGAKELVSGKIDLASVAIVNNMVFYSTANNPDDIYQTDLSFSNAKLLQKNAFIQVYNDRYIFLRERQGTDKFIYDTQSDTMVTLEIKGSDFALSGNYVYYTKNLTDEEIAESPLKDYYTYTWEEVRPRPGAKPIIKETDTQGAGRIYRVYIGAGKVTEECVFQLTYKDIPVRIKDFEIDGEAIYISFHNYEGFKNFYNQEFSGNEYATVCYAVADLQNGSVTLIEIPNEE